MRSTYIKKKMFPDKMILDYDKIMTNYKIRCTEIRCKFTRQGVHMSEIFWRITVGWTRCWLAEPALKWRRKIILDTHEDFNSRERPFVQIQIARRIWLNKWPNKDLNVLMAHAWSSLICLQEGRNCLMHSKCWN